MADKAGSAWFAKVQDDVSWTKANIESEIWYGACFTAHQAVEKALKAYLLSRSVSVRKIHDLMALLEYCISEDAAFETVREQILFVADYYLQTRYPDMSDFIEYSREKAQAALEAAEAVVEFVQDKMK